MEIIHELIFPLVLQEKIKILKSFSFEKKQKEYSYC